MLHTVYYGPGMVWDMYRTIQSSHQLYEENTGILQAQRTFPVTPLVPGEDGGIQAEVCTVGL